jgi:hypothetical protein
LWEDQFEDLLEFRKKHGHCLVADIRRKDHPDRSLSMWVAGQRRRYLEKRGAVKKMHGALTEEHEQRLTDIGFVWKAKVERPWEEYYGDLKDYHAQHGHSKVPQKFKPNMPLGHWVHRQRKYRQHIRKGSKTAVLSEERIALLDRLGFVWMTKPTPNRDFTKTKYVNRHKLASYKHPTRVAAEIAREKAQEELNQEKCNTNNDDHDVDENNGDAHDVGDNSDNDNNDDQSSAGGEGSIINGNEESDTGDVNGVQAQNTIYQIPASQHQQHHSSLRKTSGRPLPTSNAQRQQQQSQSQNWGAEGLLPPWT